MKILHIFSGVGGGISTWIRKAAMYSTGKYIVDAMAFSISNKAGFCDVIEKNHGKCFEMPRIRNGLFILIDYIKKVILKEKYDIVHCHIDGYAALPIWVAVHILCNIPLIIHSHRTAIEKISGSKYERLIYAINRLCNRVIAQYKVACGEKAKLFAFGNSRGVKILYNGIEPIENDIFEHEVKSKINILALGRLNKVKNHMYMIKIAEKLREMRYDFHLYIVGDGELKNEIENKVQEKNLSGYITLKGYCNAPEAYFSECNILIMPSFSEGLPTVVLEAQKHSCNVIASDEITKECDLDLGLVTFFGIYECDIIKWCNKIVELNTKRRNLTRNEINRAMKEKGFINDLIYREYYKYIRNIVSED